MRKGASTHVADVLLAIGVCIIAAAIYLSHYGVGNALSSDNVMPYVLFDDLFHRRVGLQGFYWPESPFYFPDTALAWLLYAATGALRPAVFAYAVADSLLFVLLVRALLLRAAPDGPAPGRPAWLMFVLLWFAVGLLGVRGGTTWFAQFYAYVFVPNNHSGALVALVAGLVILAGDKRRVGIGSLLLLGALCAATLVSDRLFEIEFLLPAIVCCALAYQRGGARWYLHAALLCVALLAGAEILRWLFPSDTLKWVAQMAGSEAGFQVGGDPTMRVGAGEALRQLLGDLATIAAADPAATVLEVIALVATAILAARIPRPGDADAIRRWLPAAFVAAAVAAPLIATVVLGRHIAIHALRYCQTVVLLLVPLALLLAQRRVLKSAPRLAVGTGVLALGSLAFVHAGLAALRDNDRGQENCLRELAAKRKLRFGVAEFWHALSMTARFAHGPVTAPLSVDAGPRMSMVTNIGWFGAIADDASSLPTLDFVDEYSYAPALLDRVFGVASERVACPRSAYRLYRPQDGALGHLYRHFQWLPGQVLQRLGRVTLPAAAWAADDGYVDGDTVHASGALPPSTPLLITAQDFPRGRLHIWLEYSLADRGGGLVRWDVSALDGNGNIAASLGQGQFADAATPTRIELPLAARPDDVPGVGISVVATGSLDVRLAAIGLRIDRD